MSEKYCVLQTSDERVDLAAAGDAIARVLGESAYDMRRKMVDASGILWHSLDETTARQMAKALSEAGVPATFRAHRSLRKTGPRMETTHIVLGHEGVEFGLDKENRHVHYRGIILMNCARVKGEFTEKRQYTGKSNAAATHSHHIHGRIADAQPIYHTYQERDPTRTFLDIFVTDPDNIIRLESQTVKYPNAGIPLGFSSMENFRRLVDALAYRCQGAVTNIGVDVLLGRGGTWPDVTFDSEKEFDRHNLWMLQLVNS